MDRDQKTTGRVRRISGIIFTTIGVLLVADMIAIYLYRGEHFRAEDWIRFWVLLWIGTLLIPSGTRLATRSRIAGWIALFVAVSGPPFLWACDRWLRNLGW